MNNLKCFILDDDPLFCSSMVKVGKSLGIQIDAFNSPLELERLSKFDYEIGIVDVDLGAVFGPEFEDYLKAIFFNCPILYVSAMNLRSIPSKFYLKNFVNKGQGFQKIISAIVNIQKEGVPAG
jgi:FixJ family two-component response regulator